MTFSAPPAVYNRCMETIYIDRLFALNLMIDYLLCLGSARVCGVRLRRMRYFAAAFAGAVYCVLSVLPGFGFLACAPVKLACGVLMALIAFGREDKLLRCCLVFFAVSAFFGGAVWALGGSSGGRLYMPLSTPVLVLSFGICYAVLSVVFRRSAKTAARQVSETELRFGGKTLLLRTLYDSGSTLSDPVTGDSVLVCSAASLAPLFPGCDLSAPASELVLSRPGCFRLIPYRTVGTDGGMLAAFRPEYLSIAGRERSDVLAAISASAISGDGFDSVIGC